MPDKETWERVRADQRAGKAPSTQAGEFIREEIHHIRAGKHGARNTKQAIAIGLSKARRAGVDLRPPRTGLSEAARENAKRAYEEGQGLRHPVRRPRVRRAVTAALKREGKSAASHQALARHAHVSAMNRSAAARSRAARQASKTKGAAERSAAAGQAARTRAAG